MTKRLETALKQLTDDELEKITREAEALIEERRARAGTTAGWKLDWVGALRDWPEKSGVEAQATAMREWAELLEKKPAK